MKKLAYAMALGLTGLVVSSPAWAIPADLDQYGCNYDQNSFYHCYYGTSAEQRIFRDQRGMFNWTSGQDLNSNKDLDGSARYTLPPHNSRGTERPSTDTGEDAVFMPFPFL